MVGKVKSHRHDESRNPQRHSAARIATKCGRSIKNVSSILWPGRRKRESALEQARRVKKGEGEKGRNVRKGRKRGKDKRGKRERR